MRWVSFYHIKDFYHRESHLQSHIYLHMISYDIFGKSYLFFSFNNFDSNFVCTFSHSSLGLNICFMIWSLDYISLNLRFWVLGHACWDLGPGIRSWVILNYMPSTFTCWLIFINKEPFTQTCKRRLSSSFKPHFVWNSFCTINTSLKFRTSFFWNGNLIHSWWQNFV